MDASALTGGALLDFGLVDVAFGVLELVDARRAIFGFGFGGSGEYCIRLRGVIAVWYAIRLPV